VQPQPPLIQKSVQPVTEPSKSPKKLGLKKLGKKKKKKLLMLELEEIAEESLRTYER